jgi:ribose transport system ATP-binding protein
MAEDKPVLVMQGIVKRFGAFTALAGIDLTLLPGRVHALVGENGAGKSTLIKIMTGAYRRDAGTVRVAGHDVDFKTPQDAQDEGVVAVYQEVNLLMFSTVAENICLGREPRRKKFPLLIDWQQMNATAKEVLDRLGLDNVDPRAQLGTLNIATRQMIAIARGVSLGARVLVLDEPTSSLTDREVQLLYEVVRRLKAQGVAIVYISHRFDELYAICDDVTVLRDGKLVETRELAGLERIDLVCKMLGKQREELRAGVTAFRKHDVDAGEKPLLRVDGVGHGTRLLDVSLHVARGEILGVAGLLGSGRTETARVIFGLDRPNKGKVELDGKTLALRSPREAIAEGMAFLPEDRKAQGIIPELSVRENLTLALLPRLAKLGVISKKKQREVVDKYMQRLRVKAFSPDQKIRELSGGNQQKVLLARWLCRNPRLLILDEPTRGIDIGARGEIQALVAEMAEDGLGVLMISSDLEELVEGSSRLVVLRDGKSVAELRGDDIAQGRIIEAMAEAGR